MNLPAENDDPLLQSLDERGVLRLTMNRPEVHNAFDDDQTQRLITALETARSDAAVRVVILGSNGRSFSAGGDLNYMRRMGSNTYEENLEDAGQLARLMQTLNTLPKPTLARVQGGAFGGAVGLVSCCDMAVGTPRAKFGLSEVRVGLAPATIAPYVVRAIGERAARRYFMTGEPIGAETALQLGLLSELVPETYLDTRLNDLVDTLLQNAPIATQKAKQIVFDVSGAPISQDMIDHTVRYIADMRDSAEGREGLSAFLEKRQPDWTTARDSST
jgi:methylglutaconyl-CoA hydratase